MRLAGMTDDVIKAFEKSGTVQSRFTITAPISGVVAELAAREGMTVASGAPLFRINALATVWVDAQVPESLARRVRPGGAAPARTPGLSPGPLAGPGDA